MVVRFTTTYVISAYHRWSCEFESCSGEVYSIQHYMIKFDSDLQIRVITKLPNSEQSSKGKVKTHK
jgi:hypothetical protein